MSGESDDLRTALMLVETAVDVLDEDCDACDAFHQSMTLDDCAECSVGRARDALSDALRLLREAER